MPINISTQGCKMTRPGMTNIYCTQIKLRAAAHQAIYLVIFHQVAGSSVLIINFTNRPMQGFKERGVINVAIYMPINLLYELKKYEDTSYAVWLCRTSQSNMLAKKFFITHMGISCTKCWNPPLLSQTISIKQARGESETHISSFKMCLMARAY